MSDSRENPRRRDARPIGALVAAAIEPLCAKRGFARADLIAAWGDVVGPRYARCTQPESLAWPRPGQRNAGEGATLVIRVDQGMAIYLQHETALVRERVNGFLGFGAVAAIRLVQGPVAAPARNEPQPPPLREPARAVADQLAGIGSETLREALSRLGRLVYGSVERS